jgi:hypothetical protein
LFGSSAQGRRKEPRIRYSRFVICFFGQQGHWPFKYHRFLSIPLILAGAGLSDMSVKLRWRGAFLTLFSIGTVLACLPGEKIATSSRPSSPVAANLEPSQALQSATSYAIRPTNDLPEPRSADPRCSDELADDGAAAPTIAGADKGFPQSIALWA